MTTPSSNLAFGKELNLARSVVIADLSSRDKEADRAVAGAHTTFGKAIRRPSHLLDVPVAVGRAIK